MFLFGKKKQKKRKIPKSVQQSIPIDRVYRDGMFRCGHKFTRTWRFSDINYAVASDDDQLTMFLAHSALINGFPTDAMAKINVFNRQLSHMGIGVGAKDKSIIDRCTIRVFADYMNGRSDKQPTLMQLRDELLNQPEPEAHDLALCLEMFTTGSLNAFAHQSNVDVNKRIISYDILELGEQMKSIGLLIMLDNIMNRVIENRRRGRYTRVYIDEAHLFFKNQYSADFLLKAWKRFRKYGGLLTGITQNISDCLNNETASGMLANSEFLLMLNQSPSDRKDLSELLNISDTQMSYITNAGAGRGLIKVGGSIVPFVNDFPTDTELYKLMSTKPGEG